MSSSLSPVYLTIIGVVSDSGLSLTQKHVAGGVPSTHPLPWIKPSAGVVPVLL